jgi:M6 family metalloprotease-like protein
MTWEPPWGYQNIGVIAHETGHGFGLPHSYWNPNVVYDNKWDVMSGIWSNGDRGAVDPVYGTMGQHTIFYHKDILGWIDESQTAIIGTGEIKTLSLERLALPQTDDFLGVRILVDDSPAHFLTVEARNLVGYDAWLPPIEYGWTQAVVLHDVHIYASSRD